MRKTDKKIENKLRVALTDVCETSLKEYHGFQWLTHAVDYQDFPKSLKIICMFDSKESLSCFISQSSKTQLCHLIQTKLVEIGITLNNTSAQILFEVEKKSGNKNAELCR